MLALITSRLAAPVDEPIDRDPGIITLAASLLRAVTRRHDAAFQRRCDLAAKADHHTNV
ncbi:hypothetical protein MKK58_25940 [Methylobacterium sp. J-078]|uniref:hypothetical protein n=1 Tax=Methylobacterium sp. J-078 TaxID=2836657 RepID=UPI001FB9B6FB|nr:hypothetical protein [Methylobacterium sp. J-078]MCJ2047954.1 hypothetical protein [Methylobacterium sp. J-078]